jgi:eukaryotic-like serine/threonine-protein kinase
VESLKLGRAEAIELLDSYELLTELAAGGMATVYLARKLGVAGFQRFVAIKRLHPHLAGEREFIEMFLDEARLAALIHHPNVVPILEVGTSPRGYYLVMEYIEGDTLARLLARATTSGDKLPLRVGMRILIDTLLGLHAAHELVDDNDRPLNLVHRDVSPQNILVGIDGTSRITDFGVARAATRLTSTRAGQLKGKLAYMAPEQARGAPIDRRADLFSIGVVLWEVLANRRLFKGETEADTLNRVLFEPVPSVREMMPELCPALADVAMRALERDPDKRHATAALFADELERAAREVDAVAGATEVATYVQKVVGQQIAQQRQAVRAWLAASEPSRTTLGDESRSWLSKSGGAATSQVVSIGPTVQTPADAREAIKTIPVPREGPTLDAVALPARKRLWGAIGVFAAAGLVGAALLVTRGSGTATSAAQPSVIQPPSSAAPVVSARPLPSATVRSLRPEDLPAEPAPGAVHPVNVRKGGGAAKPGAGTPQKPSAGDGDFPRNPYR